MNLMQKRLLFVILFFLLLSSSIVAQISITGKVVDEENNPIEFVEVLLMTPDSVGIRSELADENGVFNITSDVGTFIVQVQQLSSVFFSEKMTITEDIDLGMIQSSKALALDEIVVTGKKKLVERKIDRMVFNVENSSSSSEGDALEVLRVTPGIQVQSDLVRMVGKNDVLVMVNDRMIELKDEELTNFLKSIPSEDIKSIEVITIPPVKYEAKGNSGLVNIQLKRASADSWNANIGASYRRNTHHTGGGRASFNFNKNKFSLASSFSQNRGAYYATQDDYAYFSDAIWYTQANFDHNYVRTNGRLDLAYQINPNWSIGAQYLISHSDNYIVENPYTPVIDYETDGIIRYLQSLSIIDNVPVLHSVNANTSFKLDTLGRTVTLNVDYFDFSNPDFRQYDGVSVINEPYSKKYYGGINQLDQEVVNYSAKIDVEFPTDWVSLSFGGKYSTSDSKNNISLYNSGISNDTITDFPLEYSKFKYDEDVEAVYLSANKKINEKWEAQLGVRLEATQTTTFAENLNVTTENDYVKLFPSAYLSYTPNEKSTYSLSYSRRITRPSFNALNPNLYFVNPFQTIEGNPLLQPAFTDNVELTNTYRGLVSKLYFSYEDNLFYQVPYADSTINFIRYVNENHITNYRYGLSESYTFDELKWWTSSNNLNLYYLFSKSSLESVGEDQKQFSASFSSYNDFTLNKKGTVVLNVGGYYRFPRVFRFYRFDPMGALSVGLQWFLLDKNLKISLKGNDLLKSQVWSRKSTVDGVYQEGIYYYDSRSFNVAISYKFGNNDLKVKKHQGGNKEERGRTGK